jgi:hypothetical protein
MIEDRGGRNLKERGRSLSAKLLRSALIRTKNIFGPYPMFELPPFRKCPKCKMESFGTLSVGGNNVTKRCKDCRYSHNEILPDVDKRVIYLDQFAVSELYKTKEGKRRPGAPS